MITLTCDQSANLKLLKRLESEGHVKLFAVSIEMMKKTRKIAPKRKRLPVAIFDSPFSTFDNCMIAADDSPYERIIKIMGTGHHADILHLEGHIQSKRDVFVTEDTDFLNFRTQLQDNLGVCIMTPLELEHSLKQL